MTPESRNSGARVRRPLMSSDYVNTKFPLQRPAKTRFRGNKYSAIYQGIGRRLSDIFMATENNREQSNVLLELYSVRMKLVQSEIQRSRYRIRETHYLVEALCYKLEGRRFKSRIRWIFSILPTALWPWGRLSL
jgi:hypothetical protein